MEIVTQGIVFYNNLVQSDPDETNQNGYMPWGTREQLDSQTGSGIGLLGRSPFQRNPHFEVRPGCRTGPHLQLIYLGYQSMELQSYYTSGNDYNIFIL